MVMYNMNNIKHNKIVEFLSKSSDAPFGTSGIIVIIATLGMTIAFIAFAAEQTKLLQLEFINIGFHNPKFFEDVRGIAGYDHGLSYTEPTSNYITYELMRQNIFPAGAIGIFIYILINAWGEASGMFGRGSTKPLFLKFVAMIILIFIFVPVWDVLAVEVERYGIGLLNPMYQYSGSDGTKDGISDNCVKNPSGVLLMVKHQNDIMYERLGGLGSPQEKLTSGSCDPNLRIAYVYQKAFSGATNELSEDALAELDLIDMALNNLSNIGRLIGDVIFLGMTKTMMLFTLTLSGVIIMTLRELFLALIISLLPMFILLAFIPKLGDIFGVLLKSILPLLLIPIITGAVFLTGAGIILDMEEGFVDGETETGIKNFTFWIACIALLILATTIPIIMAPILQSVASQATGMVGTAVTAGVISAMGVMKGAVAGGAEGIAAAASGASTGTIMSKFGGGIAMGAGGAMATDMGTGLGQIQGSGNAGSGIEKDMSSKMNRDTFMPNAPVRVPTPDNTEISSGAMPSQGGTGQVSSRHQDSGDSGGYSRDAMGGGQSGGGATNNISNVSNTSITQNVSGTGGPPIKLLDSEPLEFIYS